ncbi:MAG TPA: hypothetical protein VMY41_06190 [Thermohalobaculum sp.]|nr:hypothetical protein [Thermohalobaculum sp.]
MVALVALTGVCIPAVAEDLSGHYYGVEDATGASIDIKPDSEGFKGSFFDASGGTQKFSADRIGDIAEAVLDMDGRTVLMRMAPLPYGAEVAIIPFDAAGNLEMAASRIINFVRPGLNLPEPGVDFVNAPRDDRGRISANGFLASYEFWHPTGVRNGYLSLPERFRTVMRLFPAVQLDVIWKLCLAPSPNKALAIALRGQGVACPEVLDGLAVTQRSGTFAAYKVEVAEQKLTLRMSVRCADGYPESKPDCDRAARQLSAQAISLDTAGAVLARYR